MSDHDDEHTFGELGRIEGAVVRRRGQPRVEGRSPSGSAASSLEEVRSFFAEAKAECYLVGGFVRDRLLGRESRDIDLVVAGDVMALGRSLASHLGGRFVPLNEPHQVARVVRKKGDEQWHLDLSPLPATIEEELGRRDFTIDALAVPLCSPLDPSSLIDPFGGRADLASRQVRALNKDVFNADPLRLLRAVRLRAELDFTLDEATADVIRSQAARLRQAAAERMNEELSRILATPRAGTAFGSMDQLGLLTVILPELEAAKATSQPRQHHWNVLDHSIETVAALEALLHPEARLPSWLKEEALTSLPGEEALEGYFDEVLRGGRRRREVAKLAALLHDVAKPTCKTIEPDGRIRFLRHAEEGAPQAAAILRRLRFSRAEVNLVESMVRHHLRPGQLSRGEAPTRRAMYRYFRDTAGAGVDTIFLNLADHLATRGPGLDLEEWRRHLAIARCLLGWYFTEQNQATPPKLVNGHDIMAEFGLAPGPEVGRLLALVREAQAAGEVSTKEEALDLVRRHL